MNDGQKKFFDFILARVDTDKQQQAKDLLQESFSKQADGSFNQEYLLTFIPRMMACIKEDAQEEVKKYYDEF